MRRTPRVPEWIKNFRHPKYVNVYELLPSEKRLFGTETLYGDWDADVLLLAQDLGMVSALTARIEDQHSTPYGHGESVLSNLQLIDLVNRYLATSKLLYGSAIASLWRNDEVVRGKSGAPPNWSTLLHSFVTPVIRWVVSKGKFRAVACLGDCAWIGFLQASDTPLGTHPWRSSWESRTALDVVVSGRTVRAFAMCHPANREGEAKRHLNWSELATYLRRSQDRKGIMRGESKDRFGRS
jgi:hypothetical protein